MTAGGGHTIDDRLDVRDGLIPRLEVRDASGPPGPPPKKVSPKTELDACSPWGDTVCRRESGIPSDCKHQSAPDQHGHLPIVDHGAQPTWRGAELGRKKGRETSSQNGVEAAVHRSCSSG